MGGLSEKVDRKVSWRERQSWASSTQTSPCSLPVPTLRGRWVRWWQHSGPCPPSPHPQGTHVFKAADRSSLVTVILQELPPVETQDQRCGAKMERVKGSKLGAPAAAIPGPRAGGAGAAGPLLTPYLPQQRPSGRRRALSKGCQTLRSRGNTQREICLVFLPQRKTEIQRPLGLNSSDRPQPLIGHSQSK